MIIAETERLIMRSFELSDSDEYFTVISDDAVKKYVPYGSAYTLKGTIELVKSYYLCDFINDFYIVLEDKATSKIIGAIIACKLDSVSLDVCYLVNRRFRNQGYMKEALSCFVDYVFNKKRYSILKFTIENENIASRQVVQYCGATPYKKLSNSRVWRIKFDPIELL